MQEGLNKDIETVSLEEAKRRIKYTIKFTTDALAQKKLYDVIFLLERVDRLK